MKKLLLFLLFMLLEISNARETRCPCTGIAELKHEDWHDRIDIGIQTESNCSNALKDKIDKKVTAQDSYTLEDGTKIDYSCGAKLISWNWGCSYTSNN